jgi:anti-sigma regulatory factor (Ser/Thr protein kinase)
LAILEKIAVLDNLSELSDFIKINLKKLTNKFDVIHDLTLASEEIIINIIHYAYLGKNGLIKVRVFCDRDNFIKIIIEDFGQEFNPLKSDLPTPVESVATQKIGGLGIFLVRKSVDKIEYFRRKEKNILILMKRKIS